MAQIFLKAVVSAVVILGINAVAQKNPLMGGKIAALPFVSLLSVLWLFLDRRPTQEVSSFLQGVLWGLLPTAAYLIATLVGLKLHVPLWGALTLGVLVCLGASWLLQLVK